MSSIAARLPSVAPLAIVALLVVGAVLGAVSIAAAAGETTVAIRPSSATVAPGTATTYDIVVTEVHNGINAYNVTVSVGDPSVASIAGVTQPGDPQLSRVRTTGNDTNTSVTVIAALMELNTSDPPVRLLSIRVRGLADGRTTLSLAVRSLGDAAGKEYTITNVSGAILTVTGGTPTSTTTTPDTPSPTVTQTTPIGTTPATPPPTTTTKTTPSESTSTPQSPGPSTIQLAGIALVVGLILLAGIVFVRRRR